MFSSLRKRNRTPARSPQTGIRETVAGITGHIDHLVAIVRDPAAPTSDRVTACEVVRSFVEFQGLSSVTEIWYATGDATDIANPAEVRRAGWRLARSCIDHDEINNSAFTAYYASIIRRSNIEDFDLVLTCLEHLTNNGRRVVGSQAPRHLPRVLLDWIQLLAVRTLDLRSNSLAPDIGLQWGTRTEESFHRTLTYTANVLKFNMLIWDPIEIEKLMLIAVSIVRKTSEVTDCELCCALIDSVIAYGLVPATVLQPVLEILCGMLTMVPSLHEKCVSIIRKLSKSHLHNSTIVRLCRILDTPNSEITQSMRIAAAEQLKDLLLDSAATAIATASTSGEMASAAISDVGAGSPASLLGPAAAAAAAVGTGTGTGTGAGALGSTAGSGSGSRVLDDASSSYTSGGVDPDPVQLESALPFLDVLEAYARTLNDDNVSLRLALVLLECFYELVVKAGLLRMMHTTTWLWPDNADGTETDAETALITAGEDDGDVNTLKVSPRTIIEQFNRIYTRASHIANESSSLSSETSSTSSGDLSRFHRKMRELGTTMTASLLDKSSPSNLHSQILVCVRISHFLDTAACESLLDAIAAVQFCTPGVTNWFSNLREVLNRIYLNRIDKCRAHVLRIVQDIYAFDADSEGWISVEDMQWITRLTFSITPTADEATLEQLTQMFDNFVFFSDPSVFETAVEQLVAAATSQVTSSVAQNPSSAAAAATATDSRSTTTSQATSAQVESKMKAVRRQSISAPPISNSLKSVEALTIAFGRAYRLYARQALIVLESLIKICKLTMHSPDVFAKAWAVLCRLRVDRWDRLLLVNHRVEESYNAELRDMQEPLPPQLESIHAVPSLVIKVKASPTSPPDTTFDTDPLLEIMKQALTSEEARERTFIMVLINASSQLAHYRVLCESNLESKLPKLRDLRDRLEAIIAAGGSNIAPSALPSPGRRNAILSIIVHILSVLFSFRPLFPKVEHDRLIHTLVTALGKWNLTTGWVVHCFTLACYEAPSSVQRYLPQILSRFQLRITGRDSSMYILDFLLSLSLEGSLTKNFTEEDYKRVFGMCFSFIQNANDLLALKFKSDITAQWLLRLAYAAVSNLFLSMKLENRRSLVPYLTRNLVLATRDPSWVDPRSLVIYDMINRFTYSDVPLRTHMDTVPPIKPGWEVRRWLRGVAILEIRCNRKTGQAIRIIRRPAGVVTTYMEPARVSGMPCGFDALDSDMDESGGGNYTANFYFLCGQLGLATFQTPWREPLSVISARSAASPSITGGNATIGATSLNAATATAAASGGNSSGGAGDIGISSPVMAPSAASTFTSLSGPNHQNTGATNGGGGANNNTSSGGGGSVATGTENGFDALSQSTVNIDHVMGGEADVLGFSELRETPLRTNAIPLAVPEDASTNRAISSLDRVPIVDLYKVGIIYCAPGQNTESEILANSSGSAAYRRFLDKIGVLIRLKHNRMYYVGGLDTEQDLDGKYAIAWSSKIWQIIFHTITMMPNYEGDTQFASKKRHIGNDFVNIYFDESGEDFEFDIVRSQFNFINVVITPTYTDPADRQKYWKVRAFRKPGMKNTLAAYDVKVVSEDNLPLFVRNLALKASQYAAIHNLGSEYMDNWVYRLQLISTLRERIEHANSVATLKQNQSEDDNTDDSNPVNDDDLIETKDFEPPNSQEDIRLLQWMDFTRFTL